MRDPRAALFASQQAQSPAAHTQGQGRRQACHPQRRVRVGYVLLTTVWQALPSLAWRAGLRGHPHPPRQLPRRYQGLHPPRLEPSPRHGERVYRRNRRDYRHSRASRRMGRKTHPEGGGGTLRAERIF